MRKILIASHGNMAQGIVHTVSFFAGESNDIAAICAYVGDTPLEDMINEYFSTVKSEDEVIIFTDLLGGSVNRAFLPYLKREHTHLIAGVNLPMVLEIVLEPSQYMTTEEVQKIVENGKSSSIYMNNYAITSDADDE
ncbi:PTS sugar transporter subunit IIA [Erysipelothrix sp. HDW6C]|uniref:PTS sugar transporter subunit IIA n=1 Tax=Erysipelothrix sp. HDW6C TaxID=2714930 RepID=UPI00140D53B8|nr:PTS sugar transporter subunit IIA [Erysipelothrix sp. HDW6C]QIK70682.1 PTS sugar transporter subunit IIA [Erysipelothrix sp. HDW6C]